MIDIDEAFRLLDVYFEIAWTVKKDILTVDLDDAKIIGSADDEEWAYEVNSDNGGEHLIEI